MPATADSAVAAAQVNGLRQRVCHCRPLEKGTRTRRAARSLRGMTVAIYDIEASNARNDGSMEMCAKKDIECCIDATL